MATCNRQDEGGIKENFRAAHQENGKNVGTKWQIRGWSSSIVGRMLASQVANPGLISHTPYSPLSPWGVIPECTARNIGTVGVAQNLKKNKQTNGKQTQMAEPIF